MSDFAPTRNSYASTTPVWLRDLLKSENHGVTLDGDLFPSSAFPDGVVPSGTVIGKVTATGLAGPYVGFTDEVQTATITGAPTGGTFTLTFDGQTTAGIAFDADADDVEAALVALSNIGPDDVDVSKAGAVYTIRFLGALANTNVSSLTASGAGLTGGSTPGVTIATTTAGGADVGSDGRQKAVGILLNEEKVRPGGRNLCAVVHGGTVTERLLPASSGIDAAAKADLTAIAFI